MAVNVIVARAGETALARVAAATDTSASGIVDTPVAVRPAIAVVTKRWRDIRSAAASTQVTQQTISIAVEVVAMLSELLNR